jgi:cytochrome c biogenesis factor
MLLKMFDIFFGSPKYFIAVAFVMVSALIVFLGSLKPIVFDKIKNKNLRGTVLFFSSIFLSFVATALAFWIKDWDFNYYIYASVLFSAWTIVIYGLYEYTRLRLVIEKVGKIAWSKIFGEKEKDLANELNAVIEEMTKQTQKQLKTKKSKHDKDLDNA